MLPRWHILFGAVLTILIWAFAPEISPIYLILLFLSSFLIDFDHYLVAAWRTRKLGMKKAFDYHLEMKRIESDENSKGLKRKGDFHIFHTIEAHILVGILSLIWVGFFYIFIGMVFHSLTDLVHMVNKRRLYRREFFLLNWLFNR